MIVGNGLLASLFKTYDAENIIYFASGVSNSTETDPAQFLREENLIKNTIKDNPEKLFVYFSTCSIYDSSKTDSQYVLHKLKMEEIIKTSIKDFLILRVSNAVGKGGNPNLLMNYLTRAVLNNNTINVHTKATRNLIDAEDIGKITMQILKQGRRNEIINIAYPTNYSIPEIIEVLELFYKKTLNVNFVKSGSGYDIRIPHIEDYFHENRLHDKEQYLLNILKKYYA